MANITFVALVSNEYRSVFDKNLSISPPLKKIYNNELIVINDFSLEKPCVSLNKAIEDSKNDIIVFVQADVYLPEHWDSKLHEIIKNIKDGGNLNWCVLGIFGISKDNVYAGHLYSNGLQKELGKHKPPIEAIAIDETLFVLNKKTGVRFDDNFPYLYLYGNDLLLTASGIGCKNYVICNFLVHNSLTRMRSHKNCLKSVEYFRRKWKNKLPFITPYIGVYSFRLKNYYYKFKKDLKYLIRDDDLIVKVHHRDPSSIKPENV
jgi:hypothetical protein